MTCECVFVSSAAHSGSTVLDLLLGANPRLIGVGEVFRLFQPGSTWLDRLEEEVCSCGSPVRSCGFWSEALPRIEAKRSESPEAMYAALLDAFESYFGPDKILVDSSKTFDALSTAVHLLGADVKVLRVIRDVRGWSYSMRKALKRHGDYALLDLLRKRGIRGIKHFLNRGTFAKFLQWKRANQRAEARINALGSAMMVLGYEELCLSAETMLPAICEFLGVEYVPEMLTPANSGSHNILGNRMARSPEKRRGIIYDSRWFWQTDWLWPAALLRGTMRYNGKVVYRHIRGHLWDS